MKIGVGVITFNREDFFKKCINSIPSIDSSVVINDGDAYDSSSYPSHVSKVFQHTKNMGVGVSKNEALRFLIQDGCEYLFLIEDDMEIINPNVFDKYIGLANSTGIYHLNFGHHGPANKTSKGEKNPRLVVDYGAHKLALNHHCVGSFSLYTRGVIKHTGYMDDRYTNCWEHVDHTLRIIKNGLHPPFWWFADLENSDEYIREQASSTQNTSIVKNEEWKKNFLGGVEWFKYKHGCIPTDIPDTPREEIPDILKTIHKNYSR